MTSISRYAGDFEGRGITFYVYRGRACVIAARLGAVLRYGDEGAALVDVIRKRWAVSHVENDAPEMIEGRDFDLLEGTSLREFKGLLGDPEQSSAAFSSRLMVLYESGADIVCLKTEKPEGRRLRRYLADEVLPKLRRGEAVLPTEDPAPVFAPAPAPSRRDHLADFAAEAMRSGDVEGLQALVFAAAYLHGGTDRVRALLGEGPPESADAPTSTRKRTPSPSYKAGSARKKGSPRNRDLTAEQNAHVRVVVARIQGTMSQAKVGKLLGCSQTQVSQFLSGVVGVSMAAAYRIAKHANVSLDDLLEGKVS